MYEKILVPLDGSSLAEAILPYVSHLAGGLNAKVVLLAVVDPDSPAFHGVAEDDGESLSHDQLLERSESQASSYLSNLRSELSGDVDFVVSEGNPAQCIIEERERQRCDLIAMSTHGRTGIVRGFLGSVTDKVIHASDGPVLVIRAREEEEEQPLSTEVNSIIIPLDGSELSESVLPHAEELARRLSLELILIQAINVRVQDVYFGGGFYVDPTPLEEELVHGARNYLEDVSRRLRGRGLNVRWKTLLDVPAVAVAQFARETPDSIIAMSTRGRSGFTRWLVGSITEKVVREAGVPVLIVPPES